ncbi:MAG: YaeQ family protein [Pseudomonadota bacterium]
MALKPTIHKATITLSDTDRGLYESLRLTLAQHPSETVERMMVRLLAFCFHAREGLMFCKGVSDSDEADLWAHELDGTLALWIDVGEPAVDRIRKARRMARAVSVYSFNSKSPVWWSQNRAQFELLDVAVYRFDWPSVQALAGMATRNMDLSVTISGGAAYVATQTGEVELHAEPLQVPD